MANPIPCGICRQVDDAEFIVTDRTPDAQIMGVPTLGMCVQCFIKKGFEMAQALQAVLDEQSAPVPVGAGVLERIEDDEGAAPIPPSSSSPKRPKRPAPPENGAPLPEEAEAAHDHG
jgi:hypothetical protein